MSPQTVLTPTPSLQRSDLGSRLPLLQTNYHSHDEQPSCNSPVICWVDDVRKNRNVGSIQTAWKWSSWLIWQELGYFFSLSLRPDRPWSPPSSLSNWYRESSLLG